MLSPVCIGVRGEEIVLLRPSTIFSSIFLVIVYTNDDVGGGVCFIAVTAGSISMCAINTCNKIKD